MAGNNNTSAVATDSHGHEAEERHRHLQGFRWVLGSLGPDSAYYQHVSPGSSIFQFSTPRYLTASLIAACVVSGGHPRPIRGTGSSCLWDGP